MGLKIRGNRPAWKPAVTCLVPACLPPITGRGSTPRPLALVREKRINLPRCRASGARAAERYNCPSWTVARASFAGYAFLGQLLDKVGFEALLNDDN
jgi:hypothetical protein